MQSLEHSQPQKEEEIKRLVVLTLLALVLGLTPVAHADLVDNGGGLIYDPELDITWYDAALVGRNWSDANTWAASLTVGNTTAGTWRLPTTPGVTDGLTKEGEMGHLYYDELSKPQNGPLGNTSPFTNLGPYPYWSGTEYITGGAWVFDFSKGTQGQSTEQNNHYALAVHDGDVGAPVPIPGAVWLLGSGLIGLIGIRRRFRK